MEDSREEGKEEVLQPSPPPHRVMIVDLGRSYFQPRSAALRIEMDQLNYLLKGGGDDSDGDG